MEGRSFASVSLIFLFLLVSCTCMIALHINHLLASSLLSLEKCHGSVLGPVITLYSLYTLSLVCLFHSLIFQYCRFLRSGRLTSEPMLLRSDAYPKMSKKSAAISNLYLKLNADLHSAQISSSAGLSHLKVRDLKISFFLSL